MNIPLVNFPAHIHQAAPCVVSQYYVEPLGASITIEEITQFLAAGHSISLRDATENEVARAEALVALGQAIDQLTPKLNAVLDWHTPEKAAVAKAVFQHGLSIDHYLPSILDTAEA